MCSVRESPLCEGSCYTVKFNRFSLYSALGSDAFFPLNSIFEYIKLSHGSSQIIRTATSEESWSHPRLPRFLLQATVHVIIFLLSYKTGHSNHASTPYLFFFKLNFSWGLPCSLPPTV